MGYQQDVSGFATATVAGSAPTTVLVAADGVVTVPDLLSMLQGDYLRAGPDLVLVAPDGARTVIRDFFAAEPAPDLVSADGAVVSGALATRLAGPVAPGQTAQVQSDLAGSDVMTDVQLAQAEPPIGTIEAVKGTVTIIRADGTQVTAQVGDPVFADDIVQTADGSSLGLKFIDDTEFSLGSNGRMVLDEMVFDPASGDGSASFNLLAGTFSFVSGQLAKAGPDAVKVVTPVATIGIRGTSGSIGVGAGGDGAELKIVLVPDGDGSVGEIQVTTPGGQTFSLNLPMGALRMTGSTIQTFTMSLQEFNQSFGDTLSALPSGGQLLNQIRQVAPPTPADAPEGDTHQDGPPGDGDQGDGNQGDGNQGDGNQGDGNQGDGNQGERNEGEGLPENVPPPPPLPELPPLPTPLPPPPPRPVQPVQTPAPTVAPKPTVEPTPDPSSEPVPTDEPAPTDEPEPEPEPETETGEASGSDVFDVSDSTANWTVTGDTTGNTIFTGSGDDTISTGGGDDVIMSGAGDDTVSAGDGNDSIIGGSGEGDDTYDGGTGDDLVIYSSTNDGVTVYLQGAPGYADAGMATGTEIGTDVLTGIENVYGGYGNDTIIGNAADNMLYSWAGDNLIDGGAGNDYLYGGDGNNTLIGGTGDDTITGGTGANQMTSESGNNIFVSNTTATDTMVGGTGDDVYVLAGTGAVTITDTGGSDSLYISNWTTSGTFTRSGDNLVIDTGAARAILVNVFAGGTSIESIGMPNGVYTMPAYTGATILAGTSGNDILFGTSGNDTFTGSSGNDYIRGGTGTDGLSYTGTTQGVTVYLQGATGYAAEGRATGYEIGTDRLFGIENVKGGTGNDFIVGNGDANVLSGGAGNDFLFGGGGNDTLLGGDGDDVLKGGAGANVLTATSGNNTFISEGGTDTMTGGAGNDLYKLAATGITTITDFGGTDTLDVSAWGSTAATFTRVGDNLLVSNGTATATLINAFAGGTRLETVVTADGNYTVAMGTGGSVAGTNARDILLGTSGNDTFTGSAGEDYINGGAGTDGLSYAATTRGVTVHLQGAAGYPTEGRATGLDINTDRLVGIENVAGGSGDDVIVGNGAANTLSGGAGNDTLTGGDGNDTLLGGDGADTLYGVAGNNSLSGGAGNDILSGGTGANVLTAESGNNTFISTGGTDTMTGGAGNDTYKLAATGTTTITDSGGADILNVSAWGSVHPIFTRVGDDLLVSNGTATTTLVNAFAGGTRLETVVTAHGDYAVTLGTGGSLIGTGGNDILLGTSGNDVLSGGAGNDIMDGGAGTDTVSYGGTTSGLTIGLTGATGYATAGGATGSGIGIDVLLNIENVMGGSGNDTIIGNDGANLLQGGAGNDTLIGGGGNDMLYGGTGTNTLSAVSGNNTFTSQGGTDSMTGGVGNDTYVMTTTGSAVIATGGGTDVLDVSAWGSSVVIEQSGADLLLSSDTATTTAAVRVINHFGSGALGSLTTSTGTYAFAAGLVGGTGNDLIIGTSAADTITTGDGANLVYAGDGDDTVTGGAGADILIGGAGNDSLYGGDGNDTLIGTAGNNLLLGGIGDDLYVVGLGDNTISDLGGADVLDVGDLPENDDVFLRRVDGNLTAVDQNGAYSITIVDHFGAGQVERVWDPADNASENLQAGTTGTANDDIFTVWSAILQLDGLDYGTVIDGGLGDDEFFMEYNGYGLTLLGGDGNDEFIFDPTASSGQDSAYIDGGAGWDTLVLRAGKSYVVYSSAAPIGIEEIRIVGSAATTDIDFAQFADPMRVTVDGTLGSLNIQSSGMWDGYDIDVSGWTFVDMGDTALHLYGTTNGNAFQTITGTAGTDIIYAKDGTVEVIAGLGDDTVYAYGADGAMIDGGDGYDIIDFSDVSFSGGIYASLGDFPYADWFDGEVYSYLDFTGFEEIIGSSGNDEIYGGYDDDVIRGGAGGWDTLIGGSGNDTLYAGDGGGVLKGSHGDDVLHGNAVSDVEFAFDDVGYREDFGLDTIVGWKSNDTITLVEMNPNYQPVFDVWDIEIGLRYIEYDAQGQVSGGAAFDDYQGGLVIRQVGADVELWYTDQGSAGFDPADTDYYDGSVSYQIATLQDTSVAHINGNNFMSGEGGQIPW